MTDTSLDYKNYLELIKDPSYTQLYDYYSSETTMGILGVARQENPHSSFIRWILDIRGKHGYGSIPMRKFLETVCLFKEKVYYDRDSKEVIDEELWNDENNILNTSNKLLLDEIKYGRYDISNQSIATEQVLKGQRRADIFAVLKLKMQKKGLGDVYLLVLIENKIHSTEHDNQTKKYYKDIADLETIEKALEQIGSDWLNKEKILENKLYKLCIYLNAYSTSEIKEFLKEGIKEPDKTGGPFAASKEFITLNYQYLLDGVIEPLRGITGNELACQRITEYIRCLGQAKISSLSEANENNKKSDIGKTDEYVIMAVSRVEKQLAIDLWKKHSIAIYTILESCMFSSNDDFVVNDNDRDFWSSIANLYRLIDKKSLRLVEEDTVNESRTEKLKTLVKNANSAANSRQKHKFIYNERSYVSYHWPSIGYLFRNIIEAYIDKASDDGDRQREILKKLREELQKWKSSWNNETILFDDEVERIQNGSYESGKNKTMSIAEFANSFFSYLRPNREKLVDPLIYDKNHEESLNDKYEIKLKNGQKAYIARFWGVDAVNELTHDVLPNKMEDACDDSFKSLVKQEY